MHKEIGIGSMLYVNDKPFVRLVANDFSDYKVSHSGRYERLFGAGNPKYYIVLVLEPYGELVNMINGMARNEQDKYDILLQSVNQLMEHSNFLYLMQLAEAVGREVGISFDYRDVAYWGWLSPSLQFL